MAAESLTQTQDRRRADRRKGWLSSHRVSVVIPAVNEAENLPFLQLDGDGFEIEREMNVQALKAGLKITEIPSYEAARVYGEGRLRTIPDGWRVLKTIWREKMSCQVVSHAFSPVGADRDHALLEMVRQLAAEIQDDVMRMYQNYPSEVQ